MPWKCIITFSFLGINISGWKNIQKQKEKTEEKAEEAS